MRSPLAAGALASLALHGLVVALLWRAPPPPRRETIRVEVIEGAPRRAVPPAPPPPAAPLAPPPRPRLAPAKLAAALPRDAPERPTAAPEAPPPPNAPAPAASRAPIKIGVSMSSTTDAGGFTAPVGNTLYGQLPRTAPRPEEVKPYAAERIVPPTQVTALPRPVSTEIPRGEYPADALAQGLEATVVLRLLVDETGRVAEATVAEDPGHGFAAAAVRIAKRYFRFEPARRGDERVATWLRFTVRFEAP